jgi:formylglycine-generating enzyme required for sulfatase activity
MTGRIFINYRRGDDPGHTGRLFDHLQSAFEPDQLFMDVDSIAPGLDFVRVLEEQVSKCDVLLAVIGKGWIDARDAAGNRRLDNPEDFVRIEIEAGLRLGKRVIPVLVNDAEMPRADQLPETLNPLVRRNAVRLTHDRFRADTLGLIKALRAAFDATETMVRAPAAAEPNARRRLKRAPAIGVVMGVAVLGLVGAWRFVAPSGPSPSVGLLEIPGTDALVFTGPQGGPFSPPRISLQLKATGAGFHWSTEKTIPPWLNVTPNQGDLAANGSADVSISPTSAALSLAQGQHDGQVAFNNLSSGATATRVVKFVVLPKPPLPCAVSLASRAPQPLSAAEECALKPKDTFRECATCLEMVVVPAGTFTMGSPENEAGRTHNEDPPHSVSFAKPFAVGRFSVTFDEWDACVSDGGCKGDRSADEGWGRGRRPVINVSWDDAKTYLAWLSGKTGKTYRMLSEAEREYVTRAGTTTPFWWGRSISTDQANYNGTYTYGGGPKGEYRAKTMPVDTFQPNPWGLYQVHGNVWEWVEDCYASGYRGRPTDGSAWTSQDCYRVVRGGSWVGDPELLRSANRTGLGSFYRNVNLGFRVGRTLTP